MTNLTDALNAYRPQIEARIERILTAKFEDLTKRFGPTLRGVYNSECYKFFTETLRRVLTQDLRTEGGRQIAGDYRIDAAKLTAYAAAAAEQTIAAWATKIEAKMGEIENAEVLSMGGYTFHIVGTAHGKKALIEQNMIVNVSSKGTLFNQYPARIYLDGKFISEAKYKAL